MNLCLPWFSHAPITASCGLLMCLLSGLFEDVHCAAAQAEANVAAFRFGQSFDQPTPTDSSGRWRRTSAGLTGTLGSPATLTWSIVPDGTELPEFFLTANGSSRGVNEPSGLVAFLDGIHHPGPSPPGGADFTQRSWFSLIESAFERWEALSGLSYSYEPNDDGRTPPLFNGFPGVRGDQRIGGHSLDGNSGVLAYDFFPSFSDMVIDLDESYRWSHSNDNFRTFRNMLMHEIGHGFGLAHVESFGFPTGNFLMEPNLTDIFDGPQLDDILGVQRLYGDVNEAGAGNDSFQNATSLGTANFGQSLVIGADAVDTVVARDDIDFVSIDDDSDVDFFRFTVPGPGLVDISLIPLGPTYREGPQGGSQSFFVSRAKSDLTLMLLDTNGTSVLEFSNNTLRGFGEAIEGFQLATGGDYFVQISGLDDNAQFYQLTITAVPEPTSVALLLIGIFIWRDRKRHQG